jgi:hypothetical protein
MFKDVVINPDGGLAITEDSCTLRSLDEVKALRKQLTSVIEKASAFSNDPVDYTDIPDDEIVGAYIQLRDKKTDIKALLEERLDVLNVRLDLLSTVMLKRFNERGNDQVKIKGVGTAYRVTNVVAQCADWNVFYNWLISELDAARDSGKDATEVFSYFQKRLTTETVKQFMEANEGAVPFGVNIASSHAVNVRRSTK